MQYFRSKLKTTNINFKNKLLILSSIIYGLICSLCLYENNMQFVLAFIFISICSYAGYFIGKYMRNYVGNVYLSSTGGFDAFIDKIMHQYGLQIKGFLIGGILPYVIIHYFVYYYNI